MTFDDVLPTLLRVCEEFAGISDIERACAVRDLRGCVRLVVKPKNALASTDIDGLVHKLGEWLAAALGKYFVRPILATCTTDANPRESARVAVSMMSAARAWDDARYTDRLGNEQAATAGRWCLLERRLSKQTWLEPGQAGEAWALTEGAPAIATFYSFKGGVGRTTALASCAWQLARAGKKVVVLDLDLEAPGLSTLFGADSDRGMLDALVDTLAGEPPRDLSAYSAPARALGTEDALRVTVFPAGRLDIGYLEKLGRLDFVSNHILDAGDVSGVEKALRALLGKIRGSLGPDYILIDSRAGLHDLAGLSLHGLAHVDVLVSRATEQAYQGLDITVRALGLRKSEKELRCLVVHSLAPRPRDKELLEGERNAFLSRSHQIFERHIYEHEDEHEDAPDENAPGLNDTSAAHYPIVLHQDENLERFDLLMSVEPQLFSEPYVKLKERLVALCRPEAAMPQEVE